MKLSREIKTGLIVIMGILCVIFGYSFLKSTPLFDNNITLYTVYEHVGGLQPGTAVSINGYNVGTVNNIKFKDTKGNLLVTFSVKKEFSFSRNSTVELYDTGIIGGKALQINPIFDEAPNASKFDTLKASIRPSLTELAQQKLTPLFEKFESAVTDADSVLINVNQVLDTKTKRDLRQAISGLSELMVSLKGSGEILNKILKNNEEKLGGSLTNIEVLTANFAKLSDSLNNAGLGRTLSSLESTVANLDKLIGRMEKGDGTLGKLMKDEELYSNLNNASRELDLLLQDFRLNPKRYVNVSVFGKKQKDYIVPEEDPAEKIEDQ
ncbi:ABC transporter, substrate-binding protein (cluster 9, phospholipid) [hydrothermal vent metagenome]|uniref:ABC transporter, substrate-binding protein (Cluster 9, phospholipid) n=1 Tax=hydrothermal vent metagenome TaxID=652676 RepID=A0A3B0TT48_9ZZZZ